MAIFELQAERIVKIPETSFDRESVRERSDLQRLLRDNIEVVSPDTLVLAEEFGQWDEGRRRIDLLGLDRQANLVVLELKRDDVGGHMELQAVRYAAMVSTMTFEQAVRARGEYQGRCKLPGNPQDAILQFLDWTEPMEDQFAQEIRIVLVSADFSREITTSVLWLNSFGLDVRCVRVRPYNLDNRVILDVQQVIPLPEAAEYQVQVREKSQRQRESRESNIDFTRFNVSINGKTHQYQAKRNAIFLVARTLVEGGKTPDEIVRCLDRPENQLWRSVAGKVDNEAFCRKLLEESQNGPSFEPRRWYCEDDELMYSNGRTYAFSNQWGGEKWHNAMMQFKKSFPEFEISFTPATTVDDGE